MVRLSSLVTRETPRPTRPRVHLPGELAVVCCHWNPAGWKSLHRNYLRFLHEMQWWEIPTYAVEVAYDGQEFATPDAWLQIRGTARHRLWQKERLINLAVERLPERFDKVAWIDADVLFLDAEWPRRAAWMLEAWPVVQLWQRWHCADADGSVGETLVNVGPFARRYTQGEQCSPGGAWAARRDVFPLYDKHIVGSGDAMAVEGWTGALGRCLRRMNEPMRADFLAWCEVAERKVCGDIGVMPGDAMHLYHGSRKNRQYVDRWTPVIEAGYDPQRHVTVDESGLLAWTDEAPAELVEWVAGYFASRREDE